MYIVALPSCYWGTKALLQHIFQLFFNAKTGAGNNEKIEFSLQLDSNPEFTSSVLTAYARAIYRMAKEGRKGAITVFDVAPSYLSTKSASELRKELL